MKILQPLQRRAFTLVEGVVVVAVLVVLLAVGLPIAEKYSRKCCKIGCENYLKQVGIAFRIWEGDNNDKYPMAVPAAQGGRRN
jgi:competence protein ComGC